MCGEGALTRSAFASGDRHVGGDDKGDTGNASNRSAAGGRPAAWMNAPSAAILRGSSPTFKCPSSHLRVTRHQPSTEVGAGATAGGSAGRQRW